MQDWRLIGHQSLLCRVNWIFVDYGKAYNILLIINTFCIKVKLFPCHGLINGYRITLILRILSFSWRIKVHMIFYMVNILKARLNVLTLKLIKIMIEKINKTYLFYCLWDIESCQDHSFGSEICSKDITYLVGSLGLLWECLVANENGL